MNFLSHVVQALHHKMHLFICRFVLGVRTFVFFVFMYFASLFLVFLVFFKFLFNYTIHNLQKWQRHRKNKWWAQNCYFWHTTIQIKVFLDFTWIMVHVSHAYHSTRFYCILFFFVSSFFSLSFIRDILLRFTSMLSFSVRPIPFLIVCTANVHCVAIEYHTIEDNDRDVPNQSNWLSVFVFFFGTRFAIYL